MSTSFRFEEAIAHYNRAMEIDPADISFLNNRAAVYFETGQLDQCIADCDRAVELGREVGFFSIYNFL